MSSVSSSSSPAIVNFATGLRNTITTLAGATGLAITILAGAIHPLVVQNAKLERVFEVTQTGALAFGTGANALGISGQCLLSRAGAPNVWGPCTFGVGSRISGTGASTEIAFFNAPTNLSGSQLFNWDQTNKRLGIGKISPLTPLDVEGTMSGLALVTNNISVNGGDNTSVTIANTNASTTGPIVQISNKGASNISNLRVIRSDTPTRFMDLFGDGPAGYAGIVSNTNLYLGATSTIRMVGSLSIDAGNTASAKVHILSTTEQLRMAFDASNYDSFTVNSAGSLTLAATGTNPNITLTPGGAGNTLLNGNVGLGKASPAAKLDVLGTISGSRLQIAGALSGQSLKITGTGTTANTTGPLLFTNITNNRVGIGTNAPKNLLSVQGALSGRTLTLDALPAEGSSQNAVCITNQGVFQENPAVSCLVSSLRFKHDITTLQTAMDEIEKMRPVQYRDNDGNKLNVGLIAEEVEKIDGRLVFYDRDSKTVRGVKYENAVAILVKALQEEDAKITNLQKEINQIKSALYVPHK